MEPNPSKSLPQMGRRRSPATAAIIVLVMASAIGNVGGTLLFWDIFGGPITEFLLCLAIGLMIAQPCSLAVWCALGTQNFVVRVPLTMGILFCLVCIYIGTIYAMENRIPMEIPIIFVVSSFALALLIQVPLWIFRLMTGYAISPLGTRKDSEEAFQFAIKHLMIATAIAAVVAAISKYAFGSGELDGNAPWGEIVGYMTTFALFVSMITLLCVAFVYSGASRVGIGILLGLVVTVGPVGVREVVSVVNGGSDPRMLTNIYGFTISLTTALMVVLFAFHGMGYRLQRASD